jgi:3-oxoacyl-[acyl-carrier protein] reductase
MATRKILEDKIALVIGGSRGIGAAIVKQLAHDGADVGFTYLQSAQQATEVASHVRFVGRSAMTLQADNRDAVGLQAAVESAASHFGGLDILVLNAGILIRGTIEQFSVENFDTMLATNVRSIFVAVQAAIPHLRRDGRIVTIGSNTAIRTAFPGGSVYSMTKGAVAAFVRGVAIDLAPRAITVNNVQPGPTATDMTANHVDMVRPLIPLGRMGDPGEVASLVSYLCSPAAAFITGASLTIDGGYVA